MSRPAFKLGREGIELVERFSAGSRNYGRKTDSVIKKLAEEVANEVRTGVENQSFQLVALTPKYAARKARERLDPRILIATKEYIRKIKAVKIKTGAYGIEGNLELARRLEYGTKTMKARPHWEPSIDKVFGNNGLSPKEILDDILGNK